MTGFDWMAWAGRQERLAQRFPGFLANAIRGRREVLAGDGKHATDPEARAFTSRSLVVLEGIAARLGVVV